MSMLSEQCARLRSWAMQFDERADIDALAPLLASDLREAADTILSLRDRLQAAELGGTCHMDFIDEYERPSGEEDYLCECSECGSQEWEPAHDLPLYCRKCGRKVER